MDSQRRIHDMVMRFKFVRRFYLKKKRSVVVAVALSCFPQLKNAIFLSLSLFLMPF